MSEATSQTTAACEQLLDYVYDMLDAPQKAAFEQHLATCARCQAEAASFGKVRAVSAKLMPDVEPTANLTGALHAQLMHAAAQRKPSRGKLLAFPRRIMQHPAWAAAAMFVIVGSAITINVMRDKLAMPVRAIASVPTSLAVQQPTSQPVAVAAKQDQLDGVADSDGEAVVGGKGAAMKLGRPRHSSAPVKTAKAEEAGGALGGLGSAASSGGGGAGLAAKPAAHAAKKSAPSRAVADDLFEGADKAADPRAPGAKDARATSAATGVARLSKEEERSLNQAPGQQTQTKVTSELVRNTPIPGRTYAEPSGAVAPPEAAAVAPAPASALSPYKSGGGYDLADTTTRRKSSERPAASPPPMASAPQTASAPPPMASAPQTVSAPPPPTARALAPAQEVASAPADAQPQSPTARGGYYGASLPAPKAAAPQRQTEDLHARADELVRANRCDDAVKVYAELDRRAQRMSPKERANYVRCLTATGRQQTAEQQLDELKADKSVTNGLVQQAETDVQSGRRGGEKGKAAKKSDADRAKPTQQAQQPYDAVPAAASPATKR